VALRTRIPREPWHPTRAQQEAVLRLAEPAFGGYVRTRTDGTAELRTHERGGLRRYAINSDGEGVLVESRAASSRRYVWVPRLYWLAVVGGVAFFFPFCLVAVGILSLVVPIPSGWVDVMDANAYWIGRAWFALVTLGWVAGIVAWVLNLCPDARPPAGEKWTRFGGRLIDGADE
jgi:hypothetical protein